MFDFIAIFSATKKCMHHEIMTHTKKAYEISKDHSISVWKRIREILIEIVIIVFAVTLSIWLHDRSEHKHEQAQVKQFLAGLKTDLLSDISEMVSDSNTYEQGSRAFKYFRSIAYSSPDKDSLKKYGNFLYNTTSLVPNSGRYDGFKSSGNLINIEDQKLQDNISDLYQENYPSIKASTDAYINRKELLLAFYFDHIHINANGENNFPELIRTDKAQNIFGSLENVTEITGRYALALSKARMIIEEIDAYE
jgi:hypothetical protein